MATANQKYWRDRQRQLYAGLDRDAAKVEKSLDRYYKKEQARIEKEIAAYYAKYGTDDVLEYRLLLDRLSDEDRQLLFEAWDDFVRTYPEYEYLLPVRESIYRLNRLEGLRYSIQMEQLKAGAVENAAIKDHLTKWAGASYEEALGFGSAFNTVDPNLIATIVDSDWCNGANFSDRIWHNKMQMTNYMMGDFTNAVIRGDGYDTMIRDLQKRFNTTRAEAKRLVWTEGTFAVSEAAMRGFEAVGFEEYVFFTEEDDKVCPLCGALDRNRYQVKDRTPGLNFPPIHANCRCEFEIVTDDYQMPQTPRQIDPMPRDFLMHDLDYIGIEGVAIDEKKLQEKIDTLTEAFKETKFKNAFLDYGGGVKDQDYRDASAWLNAALSADGLPQELTGSARDYEVAFRGIGGNSMSGRRNLRTNHLTPLQMAEQFIKGDWFPGTGIYGDGTYCTPARSIAKNTYAKKGGRIVTILLPKDTSREILYQDVRDLYETVEESINDPYNLMGDPGRFANILGYDRIRMPNGDNTGQDFYVILNRGAVAVPKHPISKEIE